MLLSALCVHLKEKPTGRLRVRRGWFKRLVIQVEIEYTLAVACRIEKRTRFKWVDATEKHLGIETAMLPENTNLKMKEA